MTTRAASADSPGLANPPATGHCIAGSALPVARSAASLLPSFRTVKPITLVPHRADLRNHPLRRNL